MCLCVDEHVFMCLCVDVHVYMCMCISICRSSTDDILQWKMNPYKNDRNVWRIGLEVNTRMNQFINKEINRDRNDLRTNQEYLAYEKNYSRLRLVMAD